MSKRMGTSPERRGAVVASALAVFVTTAFAACAPYPLPATCDVSKYGLPKGSAGAPVELDLVDAIANLTAGVLAGDGLRDGARRGLSLSDGRAAELRMHGFGNCTDYFAMYRNAPSWCRTGGYCAVIGNMAVGRQYGRCLLDPMPSGSQSDYQLNDYGVLTVELSTPTTIQTSFTIADMDGHLFAREAGTLFGIAADGSLVRPSSIAVGAGHYQFLADLSVGDGASLGLDMAGGTAQIPIVEWVGTSTTTTDLTHGPNGNAPPSDAAAQTTFTFSAEVKTLAFLFTYAQSLNDVVPTVDRGGDEQIEQGLMLMAEPVGCSAPCAKESRQASEIMRVMDYGDGVHGRCELNIRAATSFAYDPAGASTCAEQYRCAWRRVPGSVIDGDGWFPCTLVSETTQLVDASV
jgi:hypothetical protein